MHVKSEIVTDTVRLPPGDGQIRNAFHEAGHAVFDWCLLRKTVITGAILDPPETIAYPRGKREIPAPLLRSSLLAGLWAEHIATGGSSDRWPDVATMESAAGDLQKIETMGTDIPGPDFEESAMKARDFILSHWDAICRVAGELLARGSVDHDRIGRIVRTFDA